MQWYLLKTWTGREEELVKEIRRTVPSYMYEDVFVIYTERIWRRQGPARMARQMTRSPPSRGGASSTLSRFFMAAYF